MIIIQDKLYNKEIPAPFIPETLDVAQIEQKAKENISMNKIISEEEKKQGGDIIVKNTTWDENF